LLIHPDDAEKFGVANDSPATLSNQTGSIIVSIEVSTEVLPGVVCLPHGWGHDKPGTRLRVASTVAGVNSNLLAPSDFMDRSGNHALNGIPVQLAPADRL
jgi:anaerobic selenocysteine-containing dehydrogenase